MIHAPGMLMVGSADRDERKTTFACSLIERFGAGHDLVAVKVEMISGADAEGCGYSLAEEKRDTDIKDAARLFEAGARRVFRLRVLKDSLEKGFSALMEKIGPDACVVVESNSLRHAVSPDLFFMVKERSAPAGGQFAPAAEDYADKTALADGNNFDFDFDALKILSGRWILDEAPTAVILAGGLSKRMGSDKSLLSVRSLTMLEHIHRQLRPAFEKIIVSSNEPKKWSGLGAEIVPDKIPGQGPLMGIASCLEASASERNFFVACDIPEIDLRLVRSLLDRALYDDGVVPVAQNGRYEPLFAVYRKRMLHGIKACLKTGERQIIKAFEDYRMHFTPLEDFGLRSLRNLNTMRDYEEYQNKLKERKNP